MDTRGRFFGTETSFGDGSRIPTRHPREVQRFLNKATVTFDWQKSDVMIIDNYLTMHGRTAFNGPRVISAALLTSAFETT